MKRSRIFPCGSSVWTLISAGRHTELLGSTHLLPKRCDLELVAIAMGRAEAIWVVVPKAHASEVQQPRAEPQTPSSNHIQPEKGSSQSVVVLQTQSLLWRLLPWRSLCRMAKSYPYKNNSTPVTPTACSVCGRSPTPQPPLHSGKSSQAAEHFEQGMFGWGPTFPSHSELKGEEHWSKPRLGGQMWLMPSDTGGTAYMAGFCWPPFCRTFSQDI